MSARYQWLACAAALLVPAALPAQSLPLVLQSEMGRKGAPQAFQNLDDFAACVIKHGSRDVEALLGSDYPPKHLDSGGMFLAENYDFCLRGTALLVMTATYMRGALIEAEYHRTEKGDSPIRLGKLSDSDSPWSTTVAECLVAADPAAAEALLGVPIASPAQARAFATFGDTLAACAHSAHSNQIPAELLRYEIAEVQYRRQFDQKSTASPAASK